MTDSLSERITTLEQEIEAVRAPMADVHVRFVHSTASWAADVWADYAAVTVAKNADLAQRRAEDGSLSEVKQRVQALANDASAHATNDLASIDWPHLAEDMTEGDDINGSRMFGPRSWFRITERHGEPHPPSDVSHATRNLLMRAQKLLREYDFETAHMMGYGWDETMLAQIKRYAAQHETVLEKCRDLADARRIREEKQATDLWGAA